MSETLRKWIFPDGWGPDDQLDDEPEAHSESEPEPLPDPEPDPETGFDLVEFLADEEIMSKVGWLRQTFAGLLSGLRGAPELVMPPPVEIPEAGDGSIDVKEYEAQREASLAVWRNEPVGSTPPAPIPKVSSGKLLQEAVSYLDPDAGFDFDTWMKDRVYDHAVGAFFADYLRYGSEGYGYPFIDMAYNCLKVHEKELAAPRSCFTS